MLVYSLIVNKYLRAFIAQLDRALVYGTKGWGFDSLWTHHFFIKKLHLSQRESVCYPHTLQYLAANPQPVSSRRFGTLGSPDLCYHTNIPRTTLFLNTASGRKYLICEHEIILLITSIYIWDNLSS